MSETYTPAPEADPAKPASHVQREQPAPAEDRGALVSKIQAAIKADKDKWKPAFKRMRDDMKFVRRQLPGEQDGDDRPKMNVTQRHVKTRVSTLYAKDPTFVAKRRKRRDFAIWDGKKASLDAAAQDIQMSQQTGQPPKPETVALMQDVQSALQRRDMLTAVGETMEILLEHSLSEQQPPFKPQLKQLVRRSVICCVGYLELGYQRQLEKRPASEARLQDITERLANYERLAADVTDGKTQPNTAEIEELRLVKAALENEGEDAIVREGLVYDFPSPLRIIPDRNCRQLAPGFPGARRVHKEFLLTKAEIQETYGVDIGDGYTGYCENSVGQMVKARKDAEEPQALVYETYDRKDGLKYVTCEGYKDFLGEPAPPPLPYLETFFPFLPLVFNALEEEDEIYPESDVSLIRPIQREINRKAEGIRTHRIASRPLYGAKKGVLNEEDSKSLANHQAHDIIEFEGLEEGVDIGKVFQPFPKVGVDPNLYETGTDVNMLALVVGSQEANLGKASGDSATSSSIAENSRVTNVSSEVDELDDFLSTVARLSGQVLLSEMDIETVKAVAGPGAVWPQLRAQDIAEEVYLEIEAGSSGRPNQERDAAMFERIAPTIIQLPGIDPEWMAKTAIKVMDPRLDYEDAITAGLPSIVNMNRQSQPGTGDPATDPNMQGQDGADNAPNDDQTAGGPQAAMPAPSAEQQNTQP